MKLDRKQELNVLYHMCVFRADQKNKMAALASDGLRHFWLIRWNRWTEFNETWQEARSQRLLPSLCLLGRSVNKNVRLGWFLKKVADCTQVHDMWPFGPLVMLSRCFFDFSVCVGAFSAPEPKAQVHYCYHALSVVRLSSLTFYIFDFSSETTERNSTKLDRKQDLNVLYHVCVFRADRKNKMAALASDWLRHFRLLLWNRWTEFNETWQDARSQYPLPSLCFSGR